MRITRRVQGRFSVIPATEMTPLLPGDVLEVDAAGSAKRSTSQIAEDPQRLQN